MIGKFGAAKDQWFSSFLLQVENHSSWHRLFVDPLSRAMYSSDGPDFEFVQQKRRGHCCKVSDEAAFCLIQRPYISKTLLTRRISPRGSP